MLPIKRRTKQLSSSNHLGFTLIELMIVVAIIAIILTLALPVYSNYSIRAKVGEALSVGAAAKTTTAATCVENPALAALDNTAAGYSFQESPFVQSIDISGPCTQPVITMTTHNTGASPDPVLVLTGSLSSDSDQITWSCTTTTSYVYVPAGCRS
ncbi:MAG: pilin [Gammaproteobacteria bacterium]|nr:pilin [Gammaproteobacteria bacterium]NNK32064.1 pilin [Xanthomonadales bacterium]